MKSFPSNFRFSKDRSGFSLAEMLVGIGIFSIVTSIAVGGFASALRSQRQASGLLLANSNISIAIEQIAREIRTGYDFCSGICFLDELIFTNARGENIIYRLDGEGSITRQVNLSPVEKMTAENVEVKYLSFYLDGIASRDGLQPRVTISLGVSSRESGISGNVVSLQTTVSSRLPLDT